MCMRVMLFSYFANDLFTALDFFPQDAQWIHPTEPGNLCHQRRVPPVGCLSLATALLDSWR